MQIIFSRIYIQDPSWIITMPFPKNFDGIIKAPKMAHKLQNTDKTFADLKISKRESVCKEFSHDHIIPESFEETLEIFANIPGCGLLLTTNKTCDSPFPLGVQYFNFNPKFRAAIGIHQAKREIEDDEKDCNLFKGYIGKIYQDGAKFSSTVKSLIIIIKKEWVKQLPKHNFYISKTNWSF